MGVGPGGRGELVGEGSGDDEGCGVGEVAVPLDLMTTSTQSLASGDENWEPVEEISCFVPDRGLTQ